LNSDTSAFQRSFVKEIRQCDEMERQLRISPHFSTGLTCQGFFETQIKKQKIRIRELPDDLDSSQTTAPSVHEIDVLRDTIQTNEQRLNSLLENKETLERRHAELIELRHVLRETAHFFEIVCTLYDGS
jgi:V-type H+-transporting ATPase subunit a